MTRLVVVGGGISGLAAAWAARQVAERNAPDLQILVLEREPEVGGKAQSIRHDGWLVEAGPGSFLGGRPELERLIDSCGLAGERVSAAPASARRFLWRAGRMRPVVPNPVGLARSGILSAAGFLRLLAEPLVPRRRDREEESVWGFAARRLGAEAADRLVLPMTLGVFAGDARRLSVEAAFPRMTALEREHGSLIRGLIARRGRMSSGPLSSFRGGLQSLPRALAERGGFQVRCGAEVLSLERVEGRWQVRAGPDREPIEAEAVILAGEPWAMAKLLRGVAPSSAADLEAIPCPPVAVVALGYGPSERARVPEGFGVLIPRGEGFRMLGNLWESSLYPERSPEGAVLIRALFGGQVDPAAVHLDPDQLLAVAQEEVARLYRITVPPVYHRVVRWTRAIPQYELGHPARVERIERAVGALPGVFITGFGLHAVAFADAASNGVRVGSRAASWLASQPCEGTALTSTKPRLAT